MATLTEINEFEELGAYLKDTRMKCELQGKIFKDVVANDPVLSML